MTFFVIMAMGITWNNEDYTLFCNNIWWHPIHCGQVRLIIDNSTLHVRSTFRLICMCSRLRSYHSLLPCDAILNFNFGHIVSSLHSRCFVTRLYWWRSSHLLTNIKLHPYIWLISATQNHHSKMRILFDTF